MCMYRYWYRSWWWLVHSVQSTSPSTFQLRVSFLLFFSCRTSWLWSVAEPSRLFITITYLHNHICIFRKSPVLWHWLGIRKEHPACTSWVMMCWRGYRCAAKCRWFVYGNTFHLVVIPYTMELQNGLPFWHGLIMLPGKVAVAKLVSVYMSSRKPWISSPRF